MKKILLFLFLGLMILSPETSQATAYKSVGQSEIKKNDGGGRKGKSGRYKKKKGFMWGLFKGKNQCDCPKH